MITALTDHEKLSFQEQGYMILKDVVPFDLTLRLFYALFENCTNLLVRQGELSQSRQINLKKGRDEIDLDKLTELIVLCNQHPNLLGELYDTILSNNILLRIFSREKLCRACEELLSKNNQSVCLYGYKPRLLMSVPNDDSRIYGWHQEVFYKLPEVSAVQIWAPIFEDASEVNGTIEVIPGTHLSGIFNCSWQSSSMAATKIEIPDKILDTSNAICLTVNRGDVLIFDPRLVHRSRVNSSNTRVRNTLVGLWHNSLDPKFLAPKPELSFRGRSPEDYFQSCMARTK